MAEPTIMQDEELVCHDCKKKLKSGDECIPYDTPVGQLLKCVACHKIDPMLRNWRECEVYSRIVGYIRPVQQWNPGKRQEYEDRVEYKQ